MQETGSGTGGGHCRSIADPVLDMLDTSVFEVYVFDRDTLKFLYVNQTARCNLGYTREQLRTLTLLDLMPGLGAGSFAAAGPQCRGDEKEQVYQTQCRRADGSVYPVEIHQRLVRCPDADVFVALALDISERRKMEERLDYLVRYDGLTGLLNRTQLINRMDKALDEAGLADRQVAVLLLNLDRFRNINDSLGHEAGDSILFEISGRLRAVAREGDMLARLGGDEFALVLSQIGGLDDITQVVRNIREQFLAPIPVDDKQFFLTVSIGIALYPDDGHEPVRLIRDADTALAHAKDSGGNTFQFFSAEMNRYVDRRLSLEMGLRQALQRDEFQLHYQPQAELATGGVIGVEALIRWCREGEMVSPAEFIPLAEDIGLIVPIGEWVLRTACRQAMAWQAAGLPSIRISVNLSVRQFREESLIERVRDILMETGLEPGRLELEITESAIMHDPGSVQAKLDSLVALGVGIAIDDFGTGYSSLGYLKRFPIGILKIDRSFVQDIISDPDDAVIAQAIISLSHSLGIRVVAEGVETEPQLHFLKKRGCDIVQGYYFSRPLPAAELARLLEENRRVGEWEAVGEGPEHTLLIVDDEPNIRQALTRALRHENFRILHASGPTEAFEILARHPVGVILSDQRMPDMSGVEFLGRVKSLYPRTVRMVLSGYTDLESVTNAINRGAVYRFLTKPWDDEVLRQHLREAFRYYALGVDTVGDVANGS